MNKPSRIDYSEEFIFDSVLDGTMSQLEIINFELNGERRHVQQPPPFLKHQFKSTIDTVMSVGRLSREESVNIKMLFDICQLPFKVQRQILNKIRHREPDITPYRVEAWEGMPLIELATELKEKKEVTESDVEPQLYLLIGYDASKIPTTK